jgi:hypothetical protein
MVRFNFSKLVGVFALIALLGVSLSSSAAPLVAVGPSAAAPSGFTLSLAWLWSLFAQPILKNGCMIDPNGLCVASPKQARDEAGVNRRPQPSARRHAD